MDEIKPKVRVNHWLGLHVTAAQYTAFRTEAEKYGYSLASLLRLRLFDRTKGLHMVRYPNYNTRLLGDALGRLIGMTSALNHNGSNIKRIAEKLDQGTRDLFGLDGALFRLNELSRDLLKLLNQIEAVIKGRPDHQ